MTATQKPAGNFVQFVVAKAKRCLAHVPLLAALSFIHVYAHGQVQPGTYTGTLSCGELLSEQSRPGWTDKVQVEVNGSQLTWSRAGSSPANGSSQYSETGTANISSEGKAFIDAQGRFLPGSTQTGSWITQGELIIENGRLVGQNLTQLSPNRHRITRRCTASIPVQVAVAQSEPRSNQGVSVQGQATMKVAPSAPTVSMSENGKSLPEPIHGKVRAAALLPDRNEAARAAVKELQLSGFFDGLPRMNERDYYRCSREGQDWMFKAASNALNGAVMTQNRERYQKDFDGWWIAMEKNCDPQFWNAAKSRLLQLAVSLKGTNSARAAMADQAKAEDLAKRNQEEEQKIAAATERNKRQQMAREEAEVTRAIEREKATAASVRAEATRADVRSQNPQNSNVPEPPSAQSAVKKDFVGSWVCLEGGENRPTIFFPDGTFILSSLQDKPRLTVISGVYLRNGDSLKVANGIAKSTDIKSGTIVLPWGNVKHGGSFWMSNFRLHTYKIIAIDQEKMKLNIISSSNGPGGEVLPGNSKAVTCTRSSGIPMLETQRKDVPKMLYGNLRAVVGW